MLYLELKNLTFIRVARNFQSELILQKKVKDKLQTLIINFYLGHLLQYQKIKSDIFFQSYWFDVSQSEASENYQYFQNWHILLHMYSSLV